MHIYLFQLRRVTWWTRHDPDEPEVSDSEEEIEDDEVEEVPKNGKTLPKDYMSFYNKHRFELVYTCQWRIYS